MKSTKTRKYSVVDLFAGAGGLSYGFIQTGRFEVKVAFENNRNAQLTYRKNHGDAEVYGDVSAALTDEMKAKLGRIDVVIGGPPCQGFSNANRQKNHAVSQNNSLIKKFVKAVLHLQPTAFVMENVSMLQSNVHCFYVDRHDEKTIKKYGIMVTDADISLLDVEYLFDGAEAIISNAETISYYLWDENDYLALNVIFKTRNNKKKLITALEKHKKKLLQLASLLITQQVVSNHILNIGGKAGIAIQEYFDSPQTSSSTEALCKDIAESIMIQRMLSKANEIHENEIIVSQYKRTSTRGLVAKVNSMVVVDYIEAILGSQSNGYTIKKGVLSATAFGAPQKRMRFVVLGVKIKNTADLTLPTGIFSEIDFRTVKDAISDLEPIEPASEVSKGNEGVDFDAVPTNISTLGRQLRNSNKLYNHVSTATTSEALKRFKAIKPGGNFHTLVDDLKTSYSDPTRTQNTIYLRLNYDQPCGTVVNVRKSMWIHPVKHRALSIREAARLQTFPDSFVFCGTKDAQYQQIGNAVPPILAKAIAEHLCTYLDEDCE